MITYGGDVAVIIIEIRKVFNPIQSDRGSEDGAAAGGKEREKRDVTFF